MRQAPKMQKRHFALIAQALRDTNAKSEQIELFIERLRSTNSLFDAGKFRDAASVPSAPEPPKRKPYGQTRALKNFLPRSVERA